MIDSMPTHTEPQPALDIRSSNLSSLVTSQRTWHDQFPILFLSRRLSNLYVRLGAAAKLSSQKKIDFLLLSVNSPITFSALLKRYSRPNIFVTEQKLQS